MPSFKNFRNRTPERRANGDGQPEADGQPLDGSMVEPVRARSSSATEMGPEHLAILRQIESEGEPLSLAEELTELTERGDIERAAQTLELLNKQGETHIAELQRMSMAELLEEARKDKIADAANL